MSLHFDIQRRKKHRYDRELNEVVDDIKTERFLDKEDVDAPIVVTKQQLEAKRREKRGLTDDETASEPSANKLSDKLGVPLFAVMLLAFAGSGIFQKIFLVFYGLSAALLIFALADTKKDLNGERTKVPLRQRLLFVLFAAGSLALAVWLTKNGT